jgi:hypothetical protein
MSTKSPHPCHVDWQTRPTHARADRKRASSVCGLSDLMDVLEHRFVQHGCCGLSGAEIVVRALLEGQPLGRSAAGGGALATLDGRPVVDRLSPSVAVSCRGPSSVVPAGAVGSCSRRSDRADAEQPAAPAASERREAAVTDRGRSDAEKMPMRPKGTMTRDTDGSTVLVLIWWTRETSQKPPHCRSSPRNRFRRGLDEKLDRKTHRTRPGMQMKNLE